VNAPRSVILSLPDGSHQIYQVPSHAKFKINGKDKTVFDLKKGMKLEATIITDSSESVVASNKLTTGETPSITLPAMADVLLVLPPSDSPSVALDSTSVVSAEPPAGMLPETGSYLPLAGALGILGIAASAGLGFARRRLRIPQA
jgi:LPXTG-motif cell wall-anchored protein